MESTTERGDVGSAQLASKTDYYGIYVNDLFDYDDKTTVTLSARALAERVTVVLSS